jgi:hypothetical protein
MIERVWEMGLLDPLRAEGFAHRIGRRRNSLEQGRWVAGWIQTFRVRRVRAGTSGRSTSTARC